ncbi:MAG: hypothetical protein ABW276_13250 [Casimicrobiaceae bacterium]
MSRTPEEIGLANILGALDKAVADAEWHSSPDGHEFREIAKHSREMHDLLLAVMQEFPQYTTEHLRCYRRTIENAIRMLEQLRGELPTLH